MLNTNNMLKQQLIEKITNLKIEEDDYIFNKEIFETTAQKIKYKDLIIRKSTRHNSYALETNIPFKIELITNTVEFFAYKKTYVNLGLSLLNMLFGNKSYIEIVITHPNTEIKQLFFFLEKEQMTNAILEIETERTYKTFHYFPETISKFPLKKENSVPIENTPSFYFGWSNQSTNTKNVSNADQLIITLNTETLCNLTELFFNIGNRENKQNEICLEYLGCNSLEARFWLPNSLAFYSNSLDDLSF